jgi:L-alanine-DL-glutamate epimerase-like enolase superfamily enzyme
VKAVREAVGDPVMLMVDGNSKFDLSVTKICGTV